MRKPSKQLKKLGVYNVPVVFRIFVKSKITNADMGKDKTEVRFEQEFNLLGKLLFAPITFLIHLVKYGICGISDFGLYYNTFRLVLKNEALQVNDLLYLEDDVPSGYITPDLSKAFPLE